MRNEVPSARPVAAAPDMRFYVQCVEVVDLDTTKALGEHRCKELGYRPASDLIGRRR